MKHLLSLLLIVVSINNISFASAEPKEVSPIINKSKAIGELVIGIPDFNMKRYDEVISIITATDGVIKVTYCENLQIFMIQFDNGKIRSAEDLFNVMEKELHDFQIFHKIGKSIDELKGLC